MEIILASKSPRRKKIFSKLGYNFNVHSSDIDEENKNKLLPYDYVRDISEKKAFSVWKKNKHNAVVAGDTIIDLKEKIIGKPKSIEEAFKIIKELSNQTHCVMSALSLVVSGKVNTIVDHSFVTFKSLSDDDIKRYISSFDILDKAGAYNIEECEQFLIKKIDGCYHNIVGFPLRKFKDSKIEKILKEL